MRVPSPLRLNTPPCLGMYDNTLHELPAVALAADGFSRRGFVCALFGHAYMASLYHMPATRCMRMPSAAVVPTPRWCFGMHDTYLKVACPRNTACAGLSPLRLHERAAWAWFPPLQLNTPHGSWYVKYIAII